MMVVGKSEIKVGIVGLGTVGGGTATVLAENADVISFRPYRPKSKFSGGSS